MAHRHKKRPCQNRQGRRRRRTPASYRHGLIEAIGGSGAGPFFSRWRSAGSKWSPLRLFWVAILMAWAPANFAVAFRGGTGDGAVPVSQVDAGQELHRLVQGASPMADAAAAGLGPTLASAVADESGSALGARGLVRVRGGRLAGGMSADGGQRKRVEVRGQREDDAAIVRDDVAAHGHGRTVGFSHRAGDGERTPASGRDAGGLPPRSLLVADAGFTGYEFYRRITASRQSFLLQVGSNVRLLRDLGYFEREGRDTVYLWPERNANEPPVVLRLIERGDGKKKMYLVTNVLDKEALSDNSAGVLYEMRWGVEVFYRSLKQTLEKRRMLSRTPEAAR